MPASKSKQPFKNLWLFNENRLLILKMLLKSTSQPCGSDIIAELNIPKNLLSYHIKMLREGGYITEKKSGKKKNYTINPKKRAKIKKILETVESD